jgi:hypothetical protein
MADCRRSGLKLCVPNAAHGCVCWMRETGVDDDDWAPKPVARPKSPTGKPVFEDVDLYAVVNRVQAQVDRGHSQ